jgi:UDP-GlcNAc3NAcA epimerase
MKVATVVGARPQFIKAAPVTRLLRQQHTEILIHTGQHYDENMSSVFFEELDIPIPEYHLGVGSGQHGQQTGAMLVEIEKVLLEERPDLVLVYGDTNSTLAGALAASKLHIPVVHVEAGLRSFNRIMPEEINRIVADHLSALLLCPSQTAIANLSAEGITRGVHLVGDVMADALNYAAVRAKERSKIIDELGLIPKDYLLATVHRAENTDHPERLRYILSAFSQLKETIIFPVHPRTRRALDGIGFDTALQSNIHFIQPVGYLDMVMLESSARVILTDSGGMQKEAYWLKVPCITLRHETEWVETVETGWNVLERMEPNWVIQAVEKFSSGLPVRYPVLYGDGQAAHRCIEIINEFGNRPKFVD